MEGVWGHVSGSSFSLRLPEAYGPGFSRGSGQAYQSQPSQMLKSWYHPPNLVACGKYCFHLQSASQIQIFQIFYSSDFIQYILLIMPWNFKRTNGNSLVSRNKKKKRKANVMNSVQNTKALVLSLPRTSCVTRYKSCHLQICLLLKD